MSGPLGAASDDLDEPTAQWSAAIARLERAQQAVLAEVSASGVPAPWFTVLAHLLATPGQRLPMGEIARQLSMTTGGFTKLADRMAQAGLIDRRGASQDRRMVYAALTDHGREQAQQARGVYGGAVRDHVFSAIGAEDVRTLAEIGRRLAAGNTTPDEPDEPAHVTARSDAEEFAMVPPPDGQDRRRRSDVPEPT